MVTRFDFFTLSSASAHPARAGEQLLRRGCGRAGFSVAIEQDDLDRDGYGTAPYVLMTVSTTPDRLSRDDPMDASSPQPSLRLDARTVVRARGRRDGIAITRASSSAGVLLITLCALTPQDRARFLRQFDRATAYMVTQAGFVMSRLFEAVPGERAGCFVNVARWTSVSAFQAAFASPAFKAIVSGGFQPKSQIMLAHLPASLTRLAFT
ncbi:antibiotic biosynthesis monooxygenase family protein [Sorangium sp. So ce128]|uniref:antibiotic biosynthesis monooxygenase family protein n=1 Tax=Sorangium sp. So ce128 TaxID=3133281 RepID=UPI003F627BA0